MGDAIKVFVRVRPPAGDEKETDSCLTVDTTHNAIIVKVKADAKIFTYDQVADTQATQVLQSFLMNLGGHLEKKNTFFTVNVAMPCQFQNS